ncbi:MAG TPA: ABC transporter permease [Tepidisphaeraceae bacterium]|jgi:lipoprotein-releasing system permease protein|nr:ABC transporter permease [Tepidisphaeraceae bacterium]
MRWFIAFRYFFSHKRQSAVCIAGVTISVTMFIAMSAMMDGFQDKFVIETVESSGHITIKDEPRETRTPILERVYKQPEALLEVHRVKPREQVKKIDNPGGLLASLARMPGIVAAAPAVQGNAIATFGTKTLNLSINGIEPERQLRVTTIAGDILEGSFDRLRTTADGIIIGKGVADLLGVKLDDSVLLAGSEGGRTTARVVGIFRTGVTPVDYSRGYMLLNDAQTLLNKKNIINEIVIRTDDYTRAQEYATQIEGMAGYRTESWQEANENFLKIFKIQDLMTYIITGALLLVAAFGVLNILVMSVLERVNDIAILKSIGYSRSDITLIYLFQGLVIGLIGAALGLGFGKLAVEGLRRIPITVEGLIHAEGLLMSEHARQYYTAFIMANIVVLIAAVYPARRAAKYDPVEVIRGAH